MLSFHVKFVQTDRETDGQTDNGKTIRPVIFRYGGIKSGLYCINKKETNGRTGGRTDDKNHAMT